MAPWWPKMFQKVGTSKQKAAKAQIAMLGRSRCFPGCCGYPSREAGLEALRKTGLGDGTDLYLSRMCPTILGAPLFTARETMVTMISTPRADGQEGGEGEMQTSSGGVGAV